MGNIYIGISGWRYPPWRGVFYPPDVIQKRELEFASRALPTIEINGSFYSLQRPESYAAWYAATPPGFVLKVRAPFDAQRLIEKLGLTNDLVSFTWQGEARTPRKRSLRSAPTQ